MISPDLRPDQYPNINWSREYDHADGGTATTYGLVQIRIRDKGLELSRSKGLLSVNFYSAPGEIDSMLAFGRSNVTQTRAFSNPSRLFDLEDFQRINDIGENTRDLIVRLHQRAVARKALVLAIDLRQALSAGLTWENENTATDAGLIEQLIESQRQRLLPEKILEATTRLKNLGVVRFSESYGFLGQWDASPEWILTQFSNPDLQKIL